MIRITDIIDQVNSYNPEADLDLIDRAYIFSASVHQGKVRLSGEPYLLHPLAVAGILADMRMDAVSIAAGLLHDVIEDTRTDLARIEQTFGPEVTHIVSGVTKISVLPFGSSQARQAERLRKMILAMADDLRVIFIKLADRLHNMRTLAYHTDKDRQVEIAQETHDIYAPIAARLGIYWMKKEFEDTAFMYLNPEDYRRIDKLVATDREEREQYIQRVRKLILEKMQVVGIDCEVQGRYKHHYSIQQKMLSQHLEFEDVYDIIAFRIILDTVPDCYAALGHIHAMWKPIDYKFKDYIARPKPNMYQSLHTTVVGSVGERIEVQIRTREMDQIAKSGIAAHWSYKEGRAEDQNVREKFQWIQQLVENQENIGDPQEFLENVRIDLFPDEVYVFTPQGEIKTVPKGATPVDFAYQVHTEVGNQCTGAKINGQLVPLRYELKTGDIVEIVTTKGHTPSKDWLNFVQTVKARAKIRQWIKAQDKARSITLGREMCEKEFRKNKLNFNALVKSGELEKAADYFGFKAVDDLIASVGYGKNTPLQVVRRFTPRTEERDEGSILDKIISKVRRKKPKTGVLVKGMDDILIRFGKCCQPVPGDPITGYITQGFGVTVHRLNCRNALKMNPERRIDVSWNIEKPSTYPVEIHVSSTDRVGLLADLAANISKHGANILNANSRTNENKTVESQFTLAVENTEQLNQVIAAIRKVKGIHLARRIDS